MGDVIQETLPFKVKELGGNPILIPDTNSYTNSVRHVSTGILVGFFFDEGILMDESVWKLLDAGFRPCRRGPFDQTQGRLFVSTKVPKTISARARPLWVPPSPPRTNAGSHLRNTSRLQTADWLGTPTASFPTLVIGNPGPSPSPLRQRKGTTAWIPDYKCRG